MLPLPDLKDRRGLVLGATGFLGRWLVRVARAAGAEVRLQVRSRKLLDALKGPYDLGDQVLVLDLCEPGALEGMLRGTRFDFVVNAAGYGIDRSERDESLAELLNSELPRRLAEQLAGSATRLVHLGSALEYGEVSGHLDEAGPTAATTLYGRTKLKGTEALSRIHARGDLHGLTARLFSVYGPGEHPGRLTPTLWQERSGSGPVALSAGLQRRDFGQVEEVARAILHLARAEAFPEPVVNVARGEFRSVRDFCERAAEVFGIARERLDFGALPTRPEEMNHEPVAIARMKKIIGSGLELDLRDGLERTRAFYEDGNRG